MTLSDRLYPIRLQGAKDPRELLSSVNGRFVEEIAAARASAVAWTAAKQGTGRAVVVTLADVEPQEVEYLWKPQIPRRKLTLAEGDGGIGKSFTFQAVAAAVSNGLMPGPDAKPAIRGEPETTLMLLAEDGIADTIRPRLEAMGADLSRIKILTGILTEGGELPLMLDEEGLRELDQAIEEQKPAWLVTFGRDGDKCDERDGPRTCHRMFLVRLRCHAGTAGRWVAM
jgi:AAA domain